MVALPVLLWRHGAFDPLVTIELRDDRRDDRASFSFLSGERSATGRIVLDYGSGNLSGSNPTPFLDKNAFVSPAAFTFGNTPRTLAKGLRAPASKGQDISLRREFGIREGVRLTFEAASLNVFNLTVFAAPNVDITSNSFGTITSQLNKPRLIQFGLRLTF